MEEQTQFPARYWCHGCSQIVDPITDVHTINCSLCRSEFVEEMDSIRSDHLQTGASDSDRTLSLWAPILLGMMTNPPRRRRFRHLEDDEDHHNNNNNNNHRHRMGIGETELDQELESFMRRRRRRSSATILQLLQGIRAGMVEGGDVGSDERERVILINPFNQTIIVQGGGGGGSFDSNTNSQNPMGDYFVGPGLELLLQHLAENDPNRYGTPPAQKEAVEALPTVKIEEEENCLQCCVCLEDFDVGSEAKEMPCNHRFHSDCIFPWLELHSSCPVCRYQLPFDESKQGAGTDNEETNNGNGEEADDSGRGFSVSLPWPFSSLFSSSRSQTANTNTSSMSSSSSSGSSTVGNSNADARESNSS